MVSIRVIRPHLNFMNWNAVLLYNSPLGRSPENSLPPQPHGVLGGSASSQCMCPMEDIDKWVGKGVKHWLDVALVNLTECVFNFSLHDRCIQHPFHTSISSAFITGPASSGMRECGTPSIVIRCPSVALSGRTMRSAVETMETTSTPSGMVASWKPLPRR